MASAALDKVLAPAERAECLRQHAIPARFLAKRFAAKEALGKALGTGIRAPVLLHGDRRRATTPSASRPSALAPELAAYLADRGLTRPSVHQRRAGLRARLRHRRNNG